MNAVAWLDPLRPAIAGLSAAGWRSLERLDARLAELCVHAPPPGSSDRSAWLLSVRQDLTAFSDPDARDSALWSLLAHFVAGFHDLDLRDAIGPGHGAMILRDGRPDRVARWTARLVSGDLVGIAMTESHGGTRIHELAVTARRQADGYWEVHGTKTWVSRINEAVAFVVFFRDPDRAISAAVVEATDHHLYRETVEPLGLGGWSWGMLRLAGVRVDPRYDLVGPRGQGLAVFRRHLTSFRPLVTAAAVGCAAGVHQCVTRTLAGRQASGGLVRVRDNALIGLGRSHAQLSAALLSTLAAGRLVEAGHPMASVTVCVGKAAGVDTALRVVTDLGPLVGAQGFQRSHRVAKARADLTGLLYADGVHDSLYRAGGKALLTGSGSQTT